MPSKKYIQNYPIFTLILFQSCCLGSKNTSLGNGYKISEFSIVENQIMYCVDKCCNSGSTIIPQTIIAYNFDENWIIAKTDSNYHNGLNDFAYWIFKKNGFLERDNDDSIKANLTGPLDSISFYHSLSARNIHLKLNDYLK